MTKRNTAEGIPSLTFVEGGIIVIADTDGEEQFALDPQAKIITEQAEIIAKQEEVIEEQATQINRRKQHAEIKPEGWLRALPGKRKK